MNIVYLIIAFILQTLAYTTLFFTMDIYSYTKDRHMFIIVVIITIVISVLFCYSKRLV